MDFTDRQKKVINFVTLQHGEQKRKYTLEPYVNHVISVAKIVMPYSIENGYEFIVEGALCHDLYEDTKCDRHELAKQLQFIGYSRNSALFISDIVDHLSDQYTSERYPEMNRAMRKLKEAYRLGGIPPIAQTIKYADLIDNTSSIIEYDPGFAKVYLKEKYHILSFMKNGEFDLYVRAIKQLPS